MGKTQQKPLSRRESQNKTAGKNNENKPDNKQKSNFQSNRQPVKPYPIPKYYGSRSNSRESSSTGDKNTTAQTSKSANKQKMFPLTKTPRGQNQKKVPIINQRYQPFKSINTPSKSAASDTPEGK